MSLVEVFLIKYILIEIYWKKTPYLFKLQRSSNPLFDEDFLIEGYTNGNEMNVQKMQGVLIIWTVLEELLVNCFETGEYILLGWMSK